MSTIELLDLLQTVPASQKSCQEVFCSTCGGKAATILGARQEFVGPASEALSKATVSDLFILGDWLELLNRIAPEAVVDVLVREAQQIGPHDIVSLDKFVFLASKYRYCSSELRSRFDQILQIAQKAAVDSRDASLTETLILVMGPDVLNNQELLSAALSMRDDPRVGKALYNKLREQLPEVRTFRG